MGRPEPQADRPEGPGSGADLVTCQLLTKEISLRAPI
jgi:hypothetical protein